MIEVIDRGGSRVGHLVGDIPCTLLGGDLGDDIGGDVGDDLGGDLPGLTRAGAQSSAQGCLPCTTSALKCSSQCNIIEFSITKIFL